MKTVRLWLIALLLVGSALALAALDAALARAEPSANRSGAANLWLVLTPVIDGFNEPVSLAFTGAVSDTRLFVVERRGVIKIVQQNGDIQATPFLSITDKVTGNQNSFPEVGLLGLAFDPAYGTNRWFYVYYTDINGDIQLSRFGASGDPDVADPTEMPILTITHQPERNHNGGQLVFGPDGYLYLGTGDGGSGGDPPNNAQNLSVRLGKILRINVSGVATYTVPATNPFTTTIGAQPEIWAWGLRNPWRFSFDKATGDLYIGDVGQGAWEEVDHQPAASTGGENYGWRCFEGTHDYNMTAGCLGPYVAPVAEYSHDQGDEAIVGGFVYRGSAYPGLIGYYLYADHASGRFWAMEPGSWAVTPLGQPAINIHPTSFGQDSVGELYLAELGGAIYRVVGPVAPPPVQTSYWLPVLSR